MLSKNTPSLFYLFCFLSISADSKELTLGKIGQKTTIEIAEVDCQKSNVDTLQIVGEVTLNYPPSNDVNRSDLTINIRCNNIYFSESDSKIFSENNLNFRIDEKVIGDVYIESIRGINGVLPQNQPVVISKASDGSSGTHGSSGRKARGSSYEYPGGRSSHSGSSGSSGANGIVGRRGVDAGQGNMGKNASNIYFRTKGGFSTPNQELIIKAVGGHGGEGFIGGNGQAGGHGGNGGNGGKGGKGNSLKGASNGGSGGNGGDGGNGGNGGNGGKGGNGGNGGQIDVIIASGFPPLDYILTAKGGNSGRGGLAGLGAAGGNAGNGGKRGCGGAAPGIIDGDPGGCGNGGSNGVAGQPGSPGNDGAYGDLGTNGQCIKTIFKYNVEDENLEDTPEIKRESC
jgi:hypothetical protein